MRASKTGRITVRFQPENRLTISKLLDDLEIRRNVTPVLHDWGGMIGMALQYLSVSKIVSNTAAFQLAEIEAGCLVPCGGRNLVWRIAILQPNALVKQARGSARRIRCRDRFDGIALQQPRPSTRGAKFVRRSRSRRSGYDIVDEVEFGLGQFVDRPTLICWGLKDFVFDHHFLKVWQKRFPRAEVLRFPDCGHYILEDATDEVVAAIKRFLQA